MVLRRAEKGAQVPAKMGCVLRNSVCINSVYRNSVRVITPHSDTHLSSPRSASGGGITR